MLDVIKYTFFALWYCVSLDFILTLDDILLYLPEEHCDLFIAPNKAHYNEDLQRLNQAKVLAFENIEYVFTAHFGIFKNIRFYRWWF